MKFEKIKAISLYENVIKQLMNLIEKNELKPGDKIPSERALAKILGISRGSLRETLRVLEVNGIIKNKPSEGRHIRDIKYGDVDLNHNQENILLKIEKSSLLEL